MVDHHVDVATAGTHELAGAQRRLNQKGLLHGIVDRYLVVGSLPGENVEAGLGLLHRSLGGRVLVDLDAAGEHLLPALLVGLIIPTFPFLSLGFPLNIADLVSE